MQKKNYPYRITYALILLLFLLGTIFYRQPFLAILFILLLILPVISIALTRSAFERFEFTLSSKVSSVTLPEKAVVLLSLKNPALLPFLNCEASFHYQNMFFPDDTQNIIALPVEAHKTKQFRFPFSVSRPGLFLFSLEKVRLTDYLHLYTFEHPLGKEIQLPIFPDEQPISFQPVNTHTESEDSEFYDPLGAPSMDIREVRPYIPGDRMQDIHWKLSARTDDLMVKQFEHSFDDSLLFLPELYRNEISDTIQTLYDISMKLIRQREVFRLALFHTDTMDFTQTVIHDGDELAQALLTLYFQTPYDFPDLAKATYQTLFPLYGDFYHIHGTAIDLAEGV